MLIILIYFSIIHFILTQDLLSDCTHLLLPSLCQCYHSGETSQLRCSNIQLDILPKLPNNMQWNALDFSFNQLISIDDYLFSKIYVEKLDLKYNRIKIIEQTAFYQIENLQHLDLNHNHLKEFNPRILLSPGETLEFFDISHNPFDYLNLGQIFNNLPVLKQFHAVSCQLNDTSLNTLFQYTNHSFQSIELIDLSSNQLTSLCKNLFDSFSHLIELRLNDNQINMIDNYIFYSLNHLKILNLANNSMKILPNLFSTSLEYINISSNFIEYFHDYFLANLNSIRQIDFNSNEHLHSISQRSFCYFNLTNLEKLSLRSNNLTSLQNFSELFCRLSKSLSIIDLNDNMNLQCHCTLIQYEKYLYNYSELTCTQQGQDRYFISNIAHTFSNCTSMNCYTENICQEFNIKQLILDGTCYKKNQMEFIKTTTMMMMMINISRENLTYINETFSSLSMNKLDFIYFFFILIITFLK